MKNHIEYIWRPYRKVEISVVDPNGEVPKWDLTKKGDNIISKDANPFDVTKQPGKRGPVESPEDRRAKRTNIDDWQVCEFLWAFLEGTKTTPEYKNLTWEKEKDDDEIQIDSNEDSRGEPEKTDGPDEGQTED